MSGHHLILRPRQRGIAMMLVMSVVAAVAVIGLVVATGLPSAARASSNLADRDQLLYLAESGLVEARHRLACPKDADELWGGAQGRCLVIGEGTYDVSVTSLSSDTCRIVATGYLHRPVGQSLMHTAQMVVRLEKSTWFSLAQHGLADSDVNLPVGVEVVGDFHANGNIQSQATIGGTLSATGSIVVTGDHVPQLAEHVPSVPTPTVDFNAYAVYRWQGTSFRAETYDPLRTVSTDTVKVDKKRTTITPDLATNPLGVVVVDGDLDMNQDLRVRGGILVIRGQLRTNGYRLDVEGQPNHFSLLVKNGVELGGRGTISVTEGPAYVTGKITLRRDAKQSEFKAPKGLVLRGDFEGEGQATIRLGENKHKNDQLGATIGYFGPVLGGSGRREVTVLSYHDSSRIH